MPDTREVATYWERIAPLITEYGVRALGAVLFLFLALLISRWIGRAAQRALEKTHVEVTLARFLAMLARWGVLVLAVIACLGMFGVQTTSFAAVIGAAGLALGLALQGALSNIAAGAMLAIFRPFRVGDLVNIAGQFGTIHAIELFTTTLDTFDNRRILIPNGQIFGTIIENFTYHPVRGMDINVGVSYAADMLRTREALLRAARSVPHRAPDMEPDVFPATFADSSVNWTVRTFAPKDKFGDVKLATMHAIQRELAREGIEIPFPHRVVTIIGAGIAPAEDTRSAQAPAM